MQGKKKGPIASRTRLEPIHLKKDNERKKGMNSPHSFIIDKPMKIVIPAIGLVIAPLIHSQPIKQNHELPCLTHTTRFIANGSVQRSNNTPSNTKLVYHVFDGRTLRAFYKVANAPSVSYNGAKLISSQQVKEGNRTFDVIRFEKSGSTVDKIEFFRETTPGAGNKVNLIHRFSDNNFVTHGEFVSVCD